MKLGVIVIALLLSTGTLAQKRGKHKKQQAAARAELTTTTTTTTTVPPPPEVEVIEEDVAEEIEIVDQLNKATNTCPEELKPRENLGQSQPCFCFDQLEDGAILLECTRLVSASQVKEIFHIYFKGQSLDGLEVRNSTLGHLLPAITDGSHIPTVLLRSNEITSIDFLTFENVEKSIVRLDLSANKITSVDFQIFSNFTQLQVLNLGENQLTVIDNFGESSSLRVLYLYSNQIDTIATDAFARLPSLELLDLRWNNLRTLSSGSLHVTAARWQLRLRSNQLSTLEGAFAQGYLPFLVELTGNNIEVLTDVVFGPLAEAALLEGSKMYLKGNPLNCDCPIAWLVRNATLLQVTDGAACEGDGAAVTDLNQDNFIGCPKHHGWDSPFLKLLPESSESK